MCNVEKGSYVHFKYYGDHRLLHEGYGKVIRLYRTRVEVEVLNKQKNGRYEALIFSPLLKDVQQVDGISESDIKVNLDLNEWFGIRS